MLRVELPPARRSEARAPETPPEDANIVDTLISLLCGIICKDEQANKTEEVGKVSELTSKSKAPLICFFFTIIIFYKWYHTVDGSHMHIARAELEIKKKNSVHAFI